MRKVTFYIPDNGNCNGCPFLIPTSGGAYSHFCYLIRNYMKECRDENFNILIKTPKVCTDRLGRQSIFNEDRLQPEEESTTQIEPRFKDLEE